MINEIKYKGFSATPSDYESLDGDLAAVVGLAPEYSALKPIAPPKPIFSLGNSQRVVVLHHTSNFLHYIVQEDKNKLFWRTKDNSSLHLLHDFSDTEIHQITTIGNVIVVLCGNGLQYFIWETDEQAYSFLGNKLPQCPISFGLQGENKRYSEINDNTFTITYNSQGRYDEFTEENKTKITEQVLAKVNKFVTQVSTDEGKFIFPFFVRYAYRLYDQSLVCHSSPILMMPCTSANPMVYATNNYVGETSSTLDVYAIAASLDYQPLISKEDIDELKRWKDVVKSIDIFISAPIFTYDQSGKCERFDAMPVSYFFGQFHPKGGGLDDAKIQSTYQMWNSHSLHSYDYGPHNLEVGVALPAIPKSEINAKIRDCSTFYKLTSIDIADLPASRTIVPIEEGYLASLVSREVMTDDYQSHDTLIPTFAHVYNNRLNIASIERIMFKGYDTASMVCYTNGWIAYYGSSFNDSAYLKETDVTIYTKVLGDKPYTLHNETSLPLSQRSECYRYLFYPDTSASEMLVVADSVGTNKFKLEPHIGLNGSVYFAGLDIPLAEENVWGTVATPSVDSKPIVTIKNKIYTSEINNPFYFPATGVNVIGAGEIIGMSTAAKALSEGQFGQFPLYAFTTDGVWALQVSSTGGYTAVQPITRDVCLHREAITQIDSAVLFATERGVMLLSGSVSICISDILDADVPFHFADMPHSDKILSLVGISRGSVNYCPFKTFINDGKMIYDYLQQRLILFNPSYDYAYVYSFESKAWGIMASDLNSVVPAYPEALAMNKRNELVDISLSDVTTGLPILFVSRPIKMENDILKTIDTIIQRGNFQKGHIKVALYGSRDMIHWMYISSSSDHYLRGFRGSPYKSFRILVIGSMDIGESISGCSLQYHLRETNQLR